MGGASCRSAHLYAGRVTGSPRPTRLIYVDDSGAEATGYATFSWIAVSLEDWRVGLAEILQWRADLASAYGIPKHYELHAVKFANGRGNPSVDASWNRRKVHRSHVFDEAFARFAGWKWLQVGSVYSKRQPPPRRLRERAGTRLRCAGSSVGSTARGGKRVGIAGDGWRRHRHELHISPP